nr:hypothetical protein [Brevibacillus agri]
MKMEEKQYVFEVKANYTGNRSLTKQKIWLTEDFKPTHAEIMDSSMKPLVKIDFTEFSFNPTFDKDAFDKDRNMTTSSLTAIPTMAGRMDRLPSSRTASLASSFQRMCRKESNRAISSLSRATARTVILNYKGAYNYKLIEARPTEASVSYEQGMPVNLGFTVGVLAQTGENTRLLTWELDGVEFTIAGDLPEEEMVNVAQSTYGLGGK